MTDITYSRKLIVVDQLATWSFVKVEGDCGDLKVSHEQDQYNGTADTYWLKAGKIVPAGYCVDRTFCAVPLNAYTVTGDGFAAEGDAFDASQDYLQRSLGGELQQYFSMTVDCAARPIRKTAKVDWAILRLIGLADIADTECLARSEDPAPASAPTAVVETMQTVVPVRRELRINLQSAIREAQALLSEGDSITSLPVLIAFATESGDGSVKYGSSRNDLSPRVYVSRG